MLATEIRVSTDRLEEAISTINREAEGFTAGMEQIKQHMNTLNDVWESDAQKSFMERFNDLHKNFVAYREVLDDQVYGLKEAVKFYQERDQAIRTETAKLDASMLFA